MLIMLHTFEFFCFVWFLFQFTKKSELKTHTHTQAVISFDHES